MVKFAKGRASSRTIDQSNHLQYNINNNINSKFPMPIRTDATCVRRVMRDELGKLKRLGTVLNNYSDDDQSSNNDENSDSDSSSGDVPRSPSPNHQDDDDDHHEHNTPPSPPPPPPSVINASTISSTPRAESYTNPTEDEHPTTEIIHCESAATAVLAFQRWRQEHLKRRFNQELKQAYRKVQGDETQLISLEVEMQNKEKQLIHALADSAQLRAQLSAVENMKEKQNESTEVEILQEDLVRALERATSAEAEVERYNKEITKLRERLKATEDEATRLDSELKSSVAFLQKEKDGVAEENRVLLEQLQRKDEEVLAQTQEINNLKSALACLRVSSTELERLKVDLPQGIGCLQSSIGIGLNSLKVPVPKTQSNGEEQEISAGPFLSQLLDVLHKLTTSLQQKVSKDGVSPEEPTCSHDLPAMLHEQQISDSHSIDGSKKEEQEQLLSHRSNRALTICWKWRWVAAASEAQALSKELENIKSLGIDFLDKSAFGSLQYSAGQEKFRSSMLKSGFQTKDFLSASQSLSFEKVFTLMASIWQASSHSAYLEKELMIKRRKFDHLFHAVQRWIQKNIKKRRIEKAVIRWLVYLLQSRKAKLNQGLTHDSYSRISPRAVDDAKNILRVPISSQSKPDNVAKKVSWSADRDVQVASMKALFLLKESVHQKLQTLESAVKTSPHQQKAGDKYASPYRPRETNPKLVNLVSSVCGELQQCFNDACSQLMVFAGTVNTGSSTVNNGHALEPRKCIRACSPRQIISASPRIGQVKKTIREKQSRAEAMLN